MDMTDEIRTRKTKEMENITQEFYELLERLQDPNGEVPTIGGTSEEEYKNKLDQAFRLYYELNMKRVQNNIERFENALKDYDAKMMKQMEDYKKDTKELLAHYISLRDRK